METRHFDPTRQIERKDWPSVTLNIVVAEVSIIVPLLKEELFALINARQTKGFTRREINIPGNWFMATRSRDEIFAAARMAATEIRTELDCGVRMRASTRERLENTYRILEPFLPTRPAATETQ